MSETVSRVLLSSLFFVTKLSGLLVVAITVVSFMGTYCELATHFHLQYAVLLLIALVVLCFSKQKAYVVVIALGLIANLVAMAPLFIGGPKDSRPVNFRVLSMNLNGQNQAYDRILKTMVSSNADVICIQELTPRVQKFLDANLKAHPYSFVDSRLDNFGIGIYSKTELIGKELIPVTIVDDKTFSDTWRSIKSMKADVNVAGQTLTILNTHPPPPMSEGLREWRNSQMLQMADMAKSAPGPAIIAGDFNATPFSPNFQDMVGRGKLVDTEIGFGVQPSWPTLIWPAMIPLDHILVRGPVKTIDRRLTESFGSDHLGVLVSLVVGP